MIDFNCFVGEWPFYKLAKNTLTDLRELHCENGIGFGYVSSLCSVFYNDFYESEKALYEEIKGTEYKQVVTVNPTLSTCCIRLEECIKDFKISGIRLIPGYHGYNLSSLVTSEVMNIAIREGLPIFISARLTDERITHLFHPEPLKMKDVCMFADRHKEAQIIVNYVKDYEAELLGTKCNIAYDISGLSGSLISGNCEILKNAVYGSAFPLRTMRSSVLLLNEIPDEILRHNVSEGAHVRIKSVQRHN